VSLRWCVRYTRLISPTGVSGMAARYTVHGTNELSEEGILEIKVRFNNVSNRASTQKCNASYASEKNCEAVALFRTIVLDVETFDLLGWSSRKSPA
jgi:hypothetical protein